MVPAHQRVSVSAVALLVFFGSAARADNPGYAEAMGHFGGPNFDGAVVVARAGRIEFLSASGIGNRQSATLLTTKSKFKIASVTKTFTAVMVLQLMQEGRIDLKATIGKYLPSYTGEGKDKVTIDHLLTYSSGIPNCEGNTGITVYQRKSTVDEFIAANSSGKLEFIPGTKFSYDNGNYILLGRIIETVTGKSFAQNLQTRILQPLGMANTAMLASQDVVVGLAPTYNIDDKTGAVLADDPMYIENYYSAGAMYSTVEDLLKFDQGIFEGALLKPATLKLMLAPRPALYNVAIGFWVTTEKFGTQNLRQATRQGSIWGANADWVHLIDKRIVVIVLSNTNATALPALARELLMVAMGQGPVAVKTASAAKAKAKEAVASPLTGTWQLDLRPTPNSEPYLKDFIVSEMAGKGFSGEFYGTPFTGGQINSDWDKTYFAFTTHDKDNYYFHSGFVDGDMISGISHSAERKFTSHWTGARKAAAAPPP
jgi:CubicO group peptidase (beta-lactamase class C family)